MITTANERNLLVSIVLGLGLGTAYMTQLRLFSYLGVSELCFLLLALLLYFFRISSLTPFSKIPTEIIRIFLVLWLIFVVPINTIVHFQYGKNSDIMQPVYVLPFVYSGLLLLLLPNMISKGEVNLHTVIKLSFFIFLITSFFSFFLPDSYYGEIRFRGLANNPNQYAYYLLSLSFILVLIDYKKFIWLSPIVAYLGLKSGSDAFYLAVIVFFFSYVYSKFLYFNQFSVNQNFLICGIVFIVCVTLIYYLDLPIKDYLIQAWFSADEGGGRLTLFLHGIEAALSAPLTGLGVGSFSGINAPFEGFEAHNNIIDLAAQFGIFFSFLVHFFLIICLILFIKQRWHMAFGMGSAYLVSGMFHYTGRHFIFWVILAILFEIYREHKLSELEDSDKESI